MPLPNPHQVSANGLAKTPPMGWNSWNKFGSRVDDAGVRVTADALVATGKKEAGYLYVNIDDTWEAERDGQGKIQTNKKFPDIKTLADYVHSKGLKIGIYSSRGREIVFSFANMGATMYGSEARRWEEICGARPETFTIAGIRWRRLVSGRPTLRPMLGRDIGTIRMLEIGNGGMTVNDYKTHMSLRSILAAPLLAGNDLQHMQPEILAILT